ncbi:MAG: succinate dehydrogenase cytochrome b subunit [Alistipes sp.]|nr:succinate dehydrogenase cytochrome b subunit [Alistipes sp.]
MGCFLTNSSVGKKLVMSISGCFLVLFILFHMSMNLTMLFSREGYNLICEFLGANWYALAGTALLAAGVAVHFIYAFILTLDNYRARGKQRYAVTVQEKGVSWASKNMLVLGIIVILGLGLHLVHFWSKMQLTEILGHHTFELELNGATENISVANGALLMAYTFSNPINLALYLVWFVALWFHLTHGVWSMFQTVGWANDTWYPRLKCIANIVATLIFLGFAVVAVMCYINSEAYIAEALELQLLAY